MSSLESFRTEHAQIEAKLTQAEALQGEPARLVAQLKTMRAEVVAHFAAKDRFYVALAAQCVAANDAAAGQLTKIFESNMTMQSAAVVRFFETLDTAAAATVASSFKTMVTVIRHRFGTEERAVFPLFIRTTSKLKERSA